MIRMYLTSNIALINVEWNTASLLLPHSIRLMQIATITSLAASSEQYNIVSAPDTGPVTTVVVI